MTLIGPSSWLGDVPGLGPRDPWQNHGATDISSIAGDPGNMEPMGTARLAELDSRLGGMLEAHHC